MGSEGKMEGVRVRGRGGANRGIHRRNKACVHVRTVSTLICMVVAVR